MTAPSGSPRKFTRAQLKSFTGGTLPDLLPDPTRLLFVGINPGLRSVAVQAHFAPRGNRFYPALYRAGITDRLVDASQGFDADDLTHLRRRGIGITCLVPGATARAAYLGREQLHEAGRDFPRQVALIRPRAVAFLGITAFRVAFADSHARVGRQQVSWGGAEVWVVPNPSGLNLHSTVDDLARAYGEVAVHAGIDLYSRA